MFLFQKWEVEVRVAPAQEENKVKYLIGLMLLPCVIWDIKTKKIPTIYLYVLLIIGFIYAICNGIMKVEWIQIGLSLLPGIFFLIYGSITKQMGSADGIIILAVGCFLLPYEVLLWIFWSFVFASVYAAILLIKKKGQRYSRFAFMPFLLLAHFFNQFICRGSVI